MSAIDTYLNNIANKDYARDVRTAIVNAIRQCYNDVNAPSLREDAFIAAIEAELQNGHLTGLDITVDNTLTQEGEAADAAAVGAAISELNASLSDVRNLTYTDYATVSMTSKSEGYKLSGTGGTSADSSCEVRRFAVTSGDILHLILSADTTYTYQWSQGTTINATNLVGTPVQGAVNDYVIVPKYAAYLFVSCLKTNTTNKVYKTSCNTFSNDALYGLFKVLSCGTYSEDVRLYIQSLKKTLGYIDRTESRTLLRDWQFDAENPTISKDESETEISVSNTVTFNEKGALLPSTDAGGTRKLHGIELTPANIGVGSFSGLSVVLDLGELYYTPNKSGYYYKLLCYGQSSGSATKQMFGYDYLYQNFTGWISRTSLAVSSRLDIPDPKLLDNKTLEVKFGNGSGASLYVDAMLFLENVDNLYNNISLIIGSDCYTALPIAVKRLRVYQN